MRFLSEKAKGFVLQVNQTVQDGNWSVCSPRSRLQIKIFEELSWKRFVKLQTEKNIEQFQATKFDIQQKIYFELHKLSKQKNTRINMDIYEA